jgi:hypothetical protein
MQARTYEYDRATTYLSDATAQALRRKEGVKAEDPVLSQTYWMPSSSSPAKMKSAALKQQSTFHRRKPIKPIVFTEKDRQTLGEVETRVDNVEKDIFSIIQQMHVSYAIYSSTAKSINKELARLKVA